MRALFPPILVALSCLPAFAQDIPAEAERALSCGAMLTLVADEVANTGARLEANAWRLAADELTTWGKSTLAEKEVAPQQIERLSIEIATKVTLSHRAEAKPRYSMDECIWQVVPRRGGWQWSHWGMPIELVRAFSPRPIVDAPPQLEADAAGLYTRLITSGEASHEKFEVRLRFDAEDRLQEVVLVPEDYGICAEAIATISEMRPLQTSNIFGTEYRLWRDAATWTELSFINLGEEWCSVRYRSMTLGAWQRLAR